MGEIYEVKLRLIASASLFGVCKSQTGGLVELPKPRCPRLAGPKLTAQAISRSRISKNSPIGEIPSVVSPVHPHPHL